MSNILSLTALQKIVGSENTKLFVPFALGLGGVGECVQGVVTAAEWPLVPPNHQA